MVAKTPVNQCLNDYLHFGQKVGNAQIRCWSDLLAPSFPQKYPPVLWKSFDSFRDGDLTGETAKRPLWGVGYRRCYCAAFKFTDDRQRAAAFVRRKRSRSTACSSNATRSAAVIKPWVGSTQAVGQRVIPLVRINSVTASRSSSDMIPHFVADQRSSRDFGIRRLSRRRL
jgi:hypothetical protein